MDQIYLSILENAKERITNSSESSLSSNNYENNVFEIVKLKLPHFDKNSAKVEIETEKMTIQNLPAGIQVRIGQIIEYAHYKFPIIGDMTLFQTILGRNIMSNVKGKTFFLKRYSEIPITGNNALIDQIRKEVEGIINDAEDKIDLFKQRTETFYTTTLKPQISKLIAEEIEKRKKKIDSENKLNPFI